MQSIIKDWGPEKCRGRWGADLYRDNHSDLKFSCASIVDRH